MASHILTPEQEATAHKLDTAGLALIGAGVAGDVMHRHAAPGSALSRFGGSVHHLGPYLDLAGLAMIAPPVMNRLAQAISPDKPKKPDAPVATGDLETSLAPPSEGVQPPERVLPPGEIPVVGRDPNDPTKIASGPYELGVHAARLLYGGYVP